MPPDRASNLLLNGAVDIRLDVVGYVFNPFALVLGVQFDCGGVLGTALGTLSLIM